MVFERNKVGFGKADNERKLSEFMSQVKTHEEEPEELVNVHTVFSISAVQKWFRDEKYFYAMAS